MKVVVSLHTRRERVGHAGQCVDHIRQKLAVAKVVIAVREAQLAHIVAADAIDELWVLRCSRIDLLSNREHASNAALRLYVARDRDEPIASSTEYVHPRDLIANQSQHRLRVCVPLVRALPLVGAISGRSPGSGMVVLEW